MAKKRSRTRSKRKAVRTTTRSVTSSRGRRLGINLEPILGVLSASIARLERQLPAFEDDPRKTKALQRSIATLQAAQQKTKMICPDEEFWFGIPVRGSKTDNG